MERDVTAAGWRNELERVKCDLDKAIQAILDGVPGSVLKDKIGNLEARKAELVELVAGSAEPTPLLHPNMAEIYRRRILELHERLYDDEGKAEAVDVFRTLIDEVTLIPEGSDLTIALRGDLAAMLTFASNKKKPSPLSEAGLMGDMLSPVSLVAGTGFEPVTFRL